MSHEATLTNRTLEAEPFAARQSGQHFNRLAQLLARIRAARNEGLTGRQATNREATYIGL
jgi:hypothetical protein